MRSASLFVGGLSLAACTTSPSSQPFAAAPTAVLDGDTFVQAGTHYRLAEIDAPELPGHCRRGRVCQPGDPFAARAELARLLARPATICQPLGLDYYKRTLVRCRNSHGDVGLQLVATGFAGRYVRSK